MKAVTISENKIIGCHQSVDLKVKLCDYTYIFNNGVGLAVHPDYRRMGIWTKMREYRSQILEDKRINFGFSTSRNPIVIQSPHQHRIGLPKSILHLVKIKNLDLHFKMIPSRTRKKIGYLILNSLNGIRNFIKPKVFPNEKIIIKKISKFDSRVDIFWEQISNDYSFIVERRQEYLNWRYCDPRGGNYHILIAEDDNDFLGYCVTRINRINENYSRGYIVDLLTLPNRKGVSNELLRRVMTVFNDSNVNIIECIAVKNSQLDSSLRKSGFFDSRSNLFIGLSMRFMKKEEIQSITGMLPLKKIHMVYGDFDLI